MNSLYFDSKKDKTEQSGGRSRYNNIRAWREFLCHVTPNGNSNAENITTAIITRLHLSNFTRGVIFWPKNPNWTNINHCILWIFKIGKLYIGMFVYVEWWLVILRNYITDISITHKQIATSWHGIATSGPNLHRGVIGKMLPKVLDCSIFSDFKKIIINEQFRKLFIFWIEYGDKTANLIKSHKERLVMPGGSLRLMQYYGFMFRSSTPSSDLSKLGG